MTRTLVSSLVVMVGAIAGLTAEQTHRIGLPASSNATSDDVLIVGVLAPGVLTATPDLDSMLDAIVLSDHRFPLAQPGERCPAGILRLRPGVPPATAERLIDEAVEVAHLQLGDADLRLGARLFSLRGKSAGR